MSAKIIIILLTAIFLTFGQVSAQTCATAPIGLAAAYSGDGNALDARSRNNGTIQGNVTFAAGEVGQGFQLAGNGDLSGNGDRVIVGNPANLQLQNFTIESWVKRSSATNLTNSPFPSSPNGTIFAYGQNGYAFFIDQNTNRLGLTNVGISLVSSNLSITDTNWHHVAVTKSGNQVVFYVDGAADTPIIYNTTFSFTTNAAIGARGDSNAQNAFFGAIDELAIYNRALTAPEVQSIFNSGTTGKCKPLATYAPDNQVLWLAGDGDALDSAGTNNGTLQNGAGFAIGKVGQSFSFDGVDDYVQTTLDVQPSALPSVTFETWVYPTGTNYNFDQAIFSGDDGGYDRQFGIAPGGTTFRVQTGTAASYDAASVDYNQWQHVAVVYTPTDIKLYKNGVLFDSGIAPSGQVSATKLVLGSNRCPPCVGAGATQPYQGKIDEASVFNRELSQSEIQSIANAGLAGKYKVQSTVPSNLIAWYAGDGNPNDLQGANNAMLQNGATYGNGKVGQGFQFDGIDDQISVPHNANQNGGTNLTVEAWIYPNSLPHGATILQKRTSGNVGGYVFEPTQAIGGGNTNNGLSFVIMIGGNYQFLFAPANSLTTNAWQHVAATYDGAFMRIYVNGVEVVNKPQTGTIDASTAPVVIGRNAVSATAFQGGIDEIGLYSRALSSSEIRDQFYAGNLGKFKGAANPTVSNQAKTGDVQLTFANLTAAGAVHETPVDAAKLPALPVNSTSTGLYYDVAASAAFTGNVTECFSLPLSGNAFNTAANFNNLKVLHLEAGVWQDRTISANFAARTLCGQTTTLSPFAIVLNYQPTAAAISIAGKVTANGRGLANARVELTGTNGKPVIAITNSFGVFTFREVEAGATYIVNVSAKRYTFAPQIVSANDNLNGLRFNAIQ